MIILRIIEYLLFVWATLIILKSCIEYKYPYFFLTPFWEKLSKRFRPIKLWIYSKINSIRSWIIKKNEVIGNKTIRDLIEWIKDKYNLLIIWIKSIKKISLIKLFFFILFIYFIIWIINWVVDFIDPYL